MRPPKISHVLFSMFAFVSVDPAVQEPDHLAVMDLTAKKLVNTVSYPAAAASGCKAVVGTA